MRDQGSSHAHPTYRFFSCDHCGNDGRARGSRRRRSERLGGGAADLPRGLITEVVVTARKRGDERLQEIPTAITAFGEETLRDMGVNDFTDFAYQVPGLTFSDTGNGEKRYIMRGVQSAGQEQVAVYYDEVPATGVQSSSGDSGSQTPDLALVDLQRIEVLKGPQGTTFGANSQTGVVRFIVNKPVLDAVEGDLRVGGESLQHGDPGATFPGPSTCRSSMTSWLCARLRTTRSAAAMSTTSASATRTSIPRRRPAAA